MPILTLITISLATGALENSARLQHAKREIAREYRTTHSSLPPAFRDAILYESTQDILERNRMDLERC